MDEDVDKGQMSVLDRIFSPNFGQIECKPRCTSFINYFGIPISEKHKTQLSPVTSVTNKNVARGGNSKIKPMVYITEEEKETELSSFELSKLNFEDVLSICQTGRSGSHCVNVGNIVKSNKTLLSNDQNTSEKIQEVEQGNCEDEFCSESSEFDFHLPEILEVKTISDLSFENIGDANCLQEDTRVNSIDRKVKTNESDSGESKIVSPIHLKSVVTDTPCKSSFIESSPIRTQLFKTQLGLDGERDAVAREIISGNVENKTSGAHCVDGNGSENSKRDATKHASLEELNIPTCIRFEVYIDTDCVANEITKRDKNGAGIVKSLLSPDSAYGTDISENPCLEDVCEQMMKNKSDSLKVKRNLDPCKVKEHTQNFNTEGLVNKSDEAKHNRKGKPHATKTADYKLKRTKHDNVSGTTDNSLGSKGKREQSIDQNTSSLMCRRELTNESYTDVWTKGSQNSQSRSEKSFQTMQLKSPRVVLERIDKHFNKHKVGEIKTMKLSKERKIQMMVDLHIGTGMNKVNKRKRKFFFDSDSESETENSKSSEELGNDDCRRSTDEGKSDVEIQRREFKRIKVCGDTIHNDKNVDNKRNKNKICSRDKDNELKIYKFKRIKPVQEIPHVPAVNKSFETSKGVDAYIENNHLLNNEMLGEGSIQEVQTLSCAEKKNNRKVMKWLEEHTETDTVQNVEPVKKSSLGAFKIPKRRTLETIEDRRKEKPLEKHMQSDRYSQNRDISMNKHAKSHKRTMKELARSMENEVTSNKLTKYENHRSSKNHNEEPNELKGDKFISTVKKKTQNVDNIPAITNQSKAFYPRKVDADSVRSKQPKSEENTGNKECNLENSMKKGENPRSKTKLELPNKNAMDPFKTCGSEVKGTKENEPKETNVKECIVDKNITKDADNRRKQAVKCEKNVRGPSKELNNVVTSMNNRESKSKLGKECLNTEKVKLAADSVCKLEAPYEQKSKHVKGDVHKFEQRNKDVNEGAHQCEQKDKHVKGEEHKYEQKDKHVKGEEHSYEQKDKYVKGEERHCQQKNKPVKGEEHKYEQKNKHVKGEEHKYEQKDKHVKGEKHNCEQKDKYVKGEERQCQQKNKHVKGEEHNYQQKDKHVKGEESQCQQKNKGVKREEHKYEQKDKYVKEKDPQCQQKNKLVKGEKHKYEQKDKHVKGEERQFEQNNRRVKREEHEYEQKNKNLKEQQCPRKNKHVKEQQCEQKNKNVKEEKHEQWYKHVKERVDRYDKLRKDTRQSKSRMYRCDICKNSFFSEEYLLLKHTAEKHGVPISDMSKFSKERKTSFNPTERQSKCQIYQRDICENSFFIEKSLLINHRDQKHSNTSENPNTRKVSKEMKQCFDQDDRAKDKKKSADVGKFPLHCEQINEDDYDRSDINAIMGVVRKEANTTSDKECVIENVDPKRNTVKNEQVTNAKTTTFLEDLTSKSNDIIIKLDLENESAKNNSNDYADCSPFRKRKISHLENKRVPDGNPHSPPDRQTERCKICCKVFFCGSIPRHMKIAHSEEIVESRALSISESNQTNHDVGKKNVADIMKTENSQQNKCDNLRKCVTLTVDNVMQWSSLRDQGDAKSSIGNEHFLNSTESPAISDSISHLSQKVSLPTSLKSPINKLPTFKETGKIGTALSRNKRASLDKRRNALKKGEHFHWKCRRCLQTFANKAVLKDHLKSTGHFLPRNKPNM